MGPEASAILNLPEAARFIGEAMGVPSDLIRKSEPVAPVIDLGSLDLSVLEPLIQSLNQAPASSPQPSQESEQL